MQRHIDLTAPDCKARRIPRPLAFLITFLSVAIALVSYRYLGHAEEVPAQIAANAFFTPWLAIHAAGAATALLLGPFQFMPALRARWRRLHRWTGRVYVLGCLVGGITGLVLALGASTGAWSSAGFGMLALAWLATTSLAWCRAVQRRIPAHQAWMIRSFALTLSAVTLRLYLPIAERLPMSEAASYQAIAFLCWIPNLVLAEVCLRHLRLETGAPD